MDEEKKQDEYSPLRSAKELLTNLQQYQLENPTLLGEILVRAAQQLVKQTKEEYPEEELCAHHITHCKKRSILRASLHVHCVKKPFSLPLCDCVIIENIWGRY